MDSETKGLTSILKLCVVLLFVELCVKLCVKLYSLITVEHQRQIYPTPAREIQAEDPHYPIICELRLTVQHSPVLRVVVHGFWMGYVDDYGVVHGLINSSPTEEDYRRGRKELRSADAATREDLETMWPSDRGSSRNFQIYEFAKHSRTNSSQYRSKYFENAIKLARPFIGGQKDLRMFLDKYRPGELYDKEKFGLELRRHIGASVRIVCSNPRERYLNEIGIIFTENLRMVDFPQTQPYSGRIMVRPPPEA